MAYRYEPNPITGRNELIIDGWESGIGASPEVGVNIKNASIEAVAKTVRPNWAINRNSTLPMNSGNGYTFTANAGTDVITLGAGSTAFNFNFVAVQFTTTGTLPAGLSLATRYYLVVVSAGAGTYKVASSLANAVANTTIDITDTGSGVHSANNTDSGANNNNAVQMKTITYMVNVPIVDPTAGSFSFAAFALDTGGKVWHYYLNTQWVLVGGNTIDNAASGSGMSYFISSGIGGTVNSYLFVFRNNQVDILNVSSFLSAYSPTWSNSWWSTSPPLTGGAGSGLPRDAILGQDNKVYFCNYNFIAAVNEVLGKNFSPSDATTYNQNQKALNSLPSNDVAQCLEQLGNNLLIGGKYTNIIYPWDKVALGFSTPLRCGENNIWKMKNIDNTVYILAGTKGHVYQTTGYAITREMKIPEYISGGFVTWGGMEKVSGQLIFGVNPNTSANAGVYKLYSNVGTFAGSIVGSLICDETISQGALLPTAFLVDSTPTEFYQVGYNGGIDLIDSTNRLSNFESFAESDVIPVGTVRQPKGFDQIEYKLDYAPTSGNIRLSWRSNLNGNYTVLNTTTSCANIISDSFPAGSIQNVQWLQIKAEISGGTGFNTPRLREIRLN